MAETNRDLLPQSSHPNREEILFTVWVGLLLAAATFLSR